MPTLGGTDRSLHRLMPPYGGGYKKHLYSTVKYLDT